jgi:hypothetical protein
MESNDRIQKSLALEKIRVGKAIEELNRDCDAEVARVVNDFAVRGVLQSGKIGARIAEIHLARAKNIIDRSLELRKSTIKEVSEVATEPYFKQLCDDLERAAATVCRSIPEHLARYPPCQHR